VIVPKVGMSFASENDAYEMYNTYAGMIGFSIRKSIIKCRADKTIYSRVIVCSSQGHAEIGSSHATTRTGCKVLLSSVSAGREFGQYKRLNLITIMF
jgi:hypothetical protein